MELVCAEKRAKVVVERSKDRTQRPGRCWWKKVTVTLYSAHLLSIGNAHCVIIGNPVMILLF